MKQVIWTPSSKKSLQETIEFLSETWNEEIVDDFLNQIDYRISQIQEPPKIAPVVESSKFRKLLIHKSISLFYRNYPEYIKIILIWDSRQDPAILKRLLS